MKQLTKQSLFYFLLLIFLLSSPTILSYNYDETLQNLSFHNNDTPPHTVLNFSDYTNNVKRTNPSLRCSIKPVKQILTYSIYSNASAEWF